MRSSSDACPSGPTGALRWPLPALLGWGGAWISFAALVQGGTPRWAAFAAAALLGATAATFGTTRWRRALIGAGFPLSFAATGLAAVLTPWAWLVPLAVLALVYPLRSWADAPLFPTPRGALAGLARHVPLAPGARMLDAGCGLGDALRELHREYPQARLEGVEWSLPLTLVARLRCRWARVRRANLWADDWSGLDFVYLFQRPESMARVVAKAHAELRPGAWLGSLEFEATALAPEVRHRCADGRMLWLYRAPLRHRQS